MIKVIIFDFSGVCSSNEEPPFIREFAIKYDLDIEAFEEAYHELMVEAEQDEITGEDMWQRLCEKFNIEIDIDKTIAEMISWKEYDQDMLKFVGSLKSKYKTALFSNYNKKYWDLIKEKIDLSLYFDLVLVSYQVKARKTNPEGFRVILEEFAVKSEEVVFIDDSQKNLLEPEQLGIHTILFKDKEQLIEDLKTIGIEVAKK